VTVLPLSVGTTLGLSISPVRSALVVWARSIVPRDRKLGRDVALKILRDNFAADPEHLAFNARPRSSRL